MLASANTGEIGRGFGKNAGEWTERVEISEEEIPKEEEEETDIMITYLRRTSVD